MADLVKKIVKFFTKKSIRRKKKITAVIVTIILILISYVFLYPIFRMVSYSFMSVSDLTNPTVNWIPTELYLENFKMAFDILNYVAVLITTVIVALIPTIFQVASTAVVGYGLAMFDFKGKKLIFVLIIASFIIIPQVITMPQFVLFTNLHIINTIFALILPALFGQGIKSTIFILIFWRFFSMIPKVVIEAAHMDGATPFEIFFKIGIPSAMPAILISFLFSFVWYWNDTYIITMFTEFSTLPIQLEQFTAIYDKMYNSANQTTQGASVSANEAIEMAATLLSIIPLLILYAFTERHFINSADTVGITGE